MLSRSTTSWTWELTTQLKFVKSYESTFIHLSSSLTYMLRPFHRRRGDYSDSIVILLDDSMVRSTTTIEINPLCINEGRIRARNSEEYCIMTQGMCMM